MALVNADYVKKESQRVIVWPKASVDGTGPEVWEDRYDRNGLVVETIQLRDPVSGLPLKESKPPEGFKNFPGYDHTDNWCLIDERGDIKRTPSGEAISLRRGQALVIHADGSVTVLADERAQYLFEASHETVTVEE